MFLIYNFHLHEEKNKKYRERFLFKIEKVIGRKINNEDAYNITIYGLEAFYLASLKKLDEDHLLESWKKMNRLWTILHKQHKFAEELFDLKYLNLLEKSILAQDFLKLAVAIDHLIKFYEQKDYISVRFINFLKKEFPFLFYSDRNFIT